MEELLSTDPLLEGRYIYPDVWGSSGERTTGRCGERIRDGVGLLDSGRYSIQDNGLHRYQYPYEHFDLTVADGGLDKLNNLEDEGVAENPPSFTCKLEGIVKEPLVGLLFLSLLKCVDCAVCFPWSEFGNWVGFCSAKRSQQAYCRLMHKNLPQMLNMAFSSRMCQALAQSYSIARSSYYYWSGLAQSMASD